MGQAPDNLEDMSWRFALCCVLLPQSAAQHINTGLTRDRTEAEQLRAGPCLALTAAPPVAWKQQPVPLRHEAAETHPPAGYPCMSSPSASSAQPGPCLERNKMSAYCMMSSPSASHKQPGPYVERDKLSAY